MKKLICAAFAVSLLATVSHAQDTPQSDISVGYSFFYILKGFTIAMNGASGSAAFNVNHWFGLAGDLGVYRAAPGGPDLTGGTYTFGPRFSYRMATHRIVPFARALFGGSHFSASTGGISGGGSEFTFGLGGGGDLLLGSSGKFALRGQLEYFGVRANGSTTNVARLSAAIVYRIGKK